MIKSMTGFGRAIGQSEKKEFTVEIKTLNSKQFDLISRVPAIYKEKELEIRSLLQQRLERGKIEITVSVDGIAAENNYTLNRELAKKYYDEIVALKKDINLDEDAPLLPTLLKLPDVIQTLPEKLKEDEWEGVYKIINLAVENCNESRIKEGQILESDFISRVDFIKQFLKNIETFEDQRILKIREKIKSDLEKYFGDKAIDENRFEQEIVYYLEKIDITEEKVRLLNHCEYFMQTMSDAKTSNGKKLNFISQELGREINTIGSKANNSDIQKLVVQMKDELEKIKEQLFNIL